jgi:hypothetical protein
VVVRVWSAVDAGAVAHSRYRQAGTAVGEGTGAGSAVQQYAAFTVQCRVDGGCHVPSN